MPTRNGAVMITGTPTRVPGPPSAAVGAGAAPFSVGGGGATTRGCFNSYRRLPSLLMDSWEFRKFASEGSVLPNAICTWDVDDDSVEEVIVGTTEGHLFVVKPDSRLPVYMHLVAGTISAVVFSERQQRLVIVTLEGLCRVFDNFLCSPAKDDTPVPIKEPSYRGQRRRDRRNEQSPEDKEEAEADKASADAARTDLQRPAASPQQQHLHGFTGNVEEDMRARYPGVTYTGFHIASNCVCGDMAIDDRNEGLLYLGSSDRRLYIYSLTYGSCLATLFVHEPITCVRYFSILAPPVPISVYNEQTEKKKGKKNNNAATTLPQQSKKKKNKTEEGGTTKENGGAAREYLSLEAAMAEGSETAEDGERMVSQMIPLLLVGTADRLVLLSASYADAQEWKRLRETSFHPLTLNTGHPLWAPETREQGATGGDTAGNAGPASGLQSTHHSRAASPDARAKDDEESSTRNAKGNDGQASREASNDRGAATAPDTANSANGRGESKQQQDGARDAKNSRSDTHRLSKRDAQGSLPVSIDPLWALDVRQELLQVSSVNASRVSETETAASAAAEKRSSPTPAPQTAAKGMTSTSSGPGSLARSGGGSSGGGGSGKFARADVARGQARRTASNVCCSTKHEPSSVTAPSGASNDKEANGVGRGLPISADITVGPDRVVIAASSEDGRALILNLVLTDDWKCSPTDSEMEGAPARNTTAGVRVSASASATDGGGGKEATVGSASETSGKVLHYLTEPLRRTGVTNTIVIPRPSNCHSGSALLAKHQRLRREGKDDTGGLQSWCLRAKLSCLWAGVIGDGVPLMQRTRVYLAKGSEYCAMFGTVGGTCYTVDVDTLAAVETIIMQDCGTFTIMAGLSRLDNRTTVRTRGRTQDASLDEVAHSGSRERSRSRRPHAEQQQQQQQQQRGVDKTSVSRLSHVGTLPCGAPTRASNTNLLRGAVGRSICCVCVSVDEISVYTVGAEAFRLASQQQMVHRPGEPAASGGAATGGGAPTNSSFPNVSFAGFESVGLAAVENGSFGNASFGHNPGSHEKNNTNNTRSNNGGGDSPVEWTEEDAAEERETLLQLSEMLFPDRPRMTSDERIYNTRKFLMAGLTTHDWQRLQKRYEEA